MSTAIKRKTRTRTPQRFLHYSSTNPDLVTKCPVPGCDRDFTRSRNQTPTNGVDLPHYISHVEHNLHCQRQQRHASWDILVPAVDTLPKSYRLQIRNLVWNNKTTDDIGDSESIDNSKANSLLESIEFEIEKNPNLKIIMFFALGAQITLFITTLL